MLTADYLKSVFGDNLFRAATNFGFKEDGTMDSGFGKSKALEMLTKGNGDQKGVASAFRNGLKQAIEERINKQRMLEVGGANGYPRLKTYMESKGMGEKFERLRGELDKAKSGLEILHALRKALGPEISDPVTLEKFLKELPNIAKDVTKDREEHERSIGIDLA